MSSTELAYLSATEQRRLFETGEVSPVEVLTAQLKRVDDLDSAINALCEKRVDQAYVAALESERRYRQGQDIRPIEGITVALKNEHALQGCMTDLGSQLIEAKPDQSNSPMTQRILNSGGIIHARTNVPEFCIVAFTDSKRYGTTRNPWNSDYTCGGSSGGSAAAIAAGMTTMASGSDGAGSIRMPAAYCGVVGLKPSYGRVPGNDAVLSLLTNVHNGPIARTVADCAQLYNAISGPYEGDPVAISPKFELPSAFAPVKGLRIALSLDLGYFDVCPQIIAATMRAADALRDAGAQVELIDLKWGVDVRETARTQLWFALGRMIQDSVGNRLNEASAYVHEAVEVSSAISADDYVASIHQVGAMNDALHHALRGYDALICPTLAQNKTPANGASSGVEDILQNAMTYPFNVLSRHPALSVPAGLADHGVPIGLQIVGRVYDDAMVMRIGATLESAIGWANWRPEVVK